VWRLAVACTSLLLGEPRRAPEQLAPVAANVPYAMPAHERQVLDVYAPAHAKDLPVVFWIHGGGWQSGDKTNVQRKPRAFVERGLVFVSTNYRLLPSVDMATIFRDVARSLGWVYANVARYGGDPRRILVMGHSAGAQLAALLCTDDRYLRAEGVPFSVLRGCVPVDGDTYDVPAIIETAETRLRAHGLPMPVFGHRLKFGNDPALHREYSVVSHVARGKGIPPFLVLYVAGHPDNTAQAKRLETVLSASSVPVRAFGAQETNHVRIDAELGMAGDPATKALMDFVTEALSR